MATTRRKSAKPRARSIPSAHRRARQASQDMSTADMFAAVSKYTSEAVDAMMKIIRSNSPDLATVRKKAEATLRKHGWAGMLPEAKPAARKRKKAKASKSPR